MEVKPWLQFDAAIVFLQTMGFFLHGASDVRMRPVGLLVPGVDANHRR
jgi:hypothetical protein